MDNKFYIHKQDGTRSELKHLQRFMDLANFMDLVEMKKLTLVNPSLWEDPFENYILKYFNNREGLKKIVSILKSINVSHIGAKMFLLTANKNSCYAQSWSYVDESDALWRIYNSNKSNISIRVKVSLDNFYKISKIVKTFSFQPINYVSDMNIENDFRTLFSNENNNIDIFQALLLKRAAFDHEKEFRLLYGNYSDLNRFVHPDIIKITPILASDAISPDSNEFYNLLLKINEIYENEPKTKDISIGEPSNFIDSVMLNPLAPDWFDKTLNQYCEKSNLNYIGKSKLYDFKEI